MKKKVLLSIGMLCLFLSASAIPPRPPATIDDAVQGTGLEQHNYVGAGWIHGTITNTFYNSTHSATVVNGAYVTFKFAAGRIYWYTEKKKTHGIVAISIDGGPETLIDLYSSTEQHVLVYTSPFLDRLATHTFKIRATGTKNAASTNYYAIHDYFVIDYEAMPPDITSTSFGGGALARIVGSSDGNSAFGYQALSDITNASMNTAVGTRALSGLYYASANTAVGYQALSNLGGMGSYGNTAVGTEAGPAGFAVNTTAIGAYAKTTAYNQVRIGNAEMTSIGGQVSWSTLSDGRFKKDLREDVSGLAFVNGLRPVSYSVDKTALHRFLGIPDSVVARFAAERKEKPVRQTGFVAQEVDALVKKSGYVFNGVDAPKNDSDPYTIRYAEFVVPLVKAVQELSAKTEEQQKQIAEQQKQIDTLLKALGKTEEGGNHQSSEISLLQNSPNPFSTNTEIKMVLPETAINAKVIIYNLEGKQMKDLRIDKRGDTSVTILGNELGAGMYIYALIVDGKVVDTKRMILTK